MNMISTSAEVILQNNVPMMGTKENRILATKYWQQLKADGLHKNAFHGGDINNAKDFWDLAQDPGAMVFIVLDRQGGEPMGHFHLTGFQGLSAFIHFSILKKYHGKNSVKYTKTAIEQLFRMVRQKDDKFMPYLETLIGVTPVDNRAACIFIRRVGFTVKCQVPYACYMKETDSYCDGLITTLLRSEVI